VRNKLEELKIEKEKKEAEKLKAKQEKEKQKQQLKEEKQKLKEERKKQKLNNKSGSKSQCSKDDAEHHEGGDNIQEKRGRGRPKGSKNIK
jgi:hypothetical protein